MRYLKFFLIFLLFTTDHLHAQWQVQLDVENFTHLDRIFFLDDSLGWAIGGATIGATSPYFYTTNRGKDWYLSEDWWDLEGTDIVFVNHDTGFIAAPDGIILKTVNGGQDWTETQTPTTQDVIRLFFADENNGWATINNFTDSSQVVHTMDGGNTWYPQQVFEVNTSSIIPIYFLNDSVGYGGGGYYDIENNDSYSCIVKTHNKGETWEIIYLSQNTFYSIDDIIFFDSLNGWAVGQKSSLNAHLIFHTVDGGETWEEQTIEDKPIPEIVNCVFFVNDTTGWIGIGYPGVVYPYGAIYFTNDGGQNWLLQQEFESGIFDIQMFNQDTGWAVGGDFVYHIDNATTIIKESNEKDFFISIIPNPSNGVFNIGTNYQQPVLNFKISDISGKTIISSGHIPLQIDISNQPQGIYFLSIQYTSKNLPHSFTKKIIKL